jgi:hypothetical protein
MAYVSIVPTSALDSDDQQLIYDTQHVADPPVVTNPMTLYIIGAVGLWLLLQHGGRHERY